MPADPIQPNREERPIRGVRGFTLLEVTIVLVIVAIMAALAIPRLGSSDNQRYELAVEQVADLLMMYAQRESLSDNVVGLQHQFNERQGLNRIALVVLEPSDDPSRPAEWIRDPVVAPVDIPWSVVEGSRVRIRADGETIFTDEYPLANNVGEARASIEIDLPGTRRSVSLILTPHALHARRIDRDVYELTVREPVDLDAAGRDREDW